jgi:hypothetical protein
MPFQHLSFVEPEHRRGSPVEQERSVRETWRETFTALAVIYR